MSQQLSAEQLKKIEENRRRALERRAQRQGQTVSISNQNSAGSNSSTTSAQRLDPAARPIQTSSSSASAPQSFVPPPQQQPQGFNSQKLGASHQQSHGYGNQVNKTNHSSSGSAKQVSIALDHFTFTTLDKPIKCSAVVVVFL